MRRLAMRAHVLAFACLMSLAICRADETASVTGLVTDPAGRSVPGVTILITNLATNVASRTVTNDQGIYWIPALQPGIYRMTLDKDGFKSIVKSGVELHIQDVASINFELQVGSVNETVTVKAGGLVINTTDATVQTVIDRNFAENLPLNGRSFQTLILLTPGTVLTSADTSSGNGGQFSVNGQRSNANNFTVDGISANIGTYVIGNSIGAQLNGANPGYTAFGGTNSLVSVDALEEFKIQTSTYAPEFGRQPGGQVSLRTRSGTNDFPGTAYDYLRNDVFDANNWFNDQQGIPKGVERQNDFGGTFGGPIFRNKTFFFFSYEGLRLLQPSTHLDTVPSLRLRQESAPDFQSVLNSWPIPDGPEIIRNGTLTGGAPYTFSESTPTHLDSFGIKIDHTFRNHLRIFGRYADAVSYISDFRISPNVFDRTKLAQRGVTVGVDTSVRPNLYNEIRLNYSVNVGTATSSLFEVGGGKAFNTSILFPAPSVQGPDQAQVFIFLPHLTATLLTGPLGKSAQRQINVTDNISLSVGAHQVKSGVDYRRLFPIFTVIPLITTVQVASESDLVSGNLSVANGSSFSLTSNIVAHPIYTNFSAYAEDTWRISKRLTATYGLRWDLNPTPGERDGIFPFNVIGIQNPPTATLAPLNSQLYKTTYVNFAPRFGLAYQVRQSPAQQTVIRGGLGIFYDLNSETSATGYGGAPFSNFAITSTDVKFRVPDATLPAPPVPAPASPPFYGVNAIDQHLRLPYTLQWNISLEQALGEQQSVTTSYVASSGYRLLRMDQLFDINSMFPRIFVTRNASSSSYQSAQVQFNRRLARGLQALASYTYSHSIDNASSAEATLSTLPTATGFVNPNIDRGNSDFDLRHSFRTAVSYSLNPVSSNIFSKTILSGWSVEAIAIVQSALPLDVKGPFYTPSTLPDAFFQLRPNVVSGIPMYLSGAQCATANGGVPCPGGKAINFTPGAVPGGCPDGSVSEGPFCPVPADQSGFPTQLQGTLGRNTLRGFGAWQMDFAVHRKFNLTDRLALEFRAEAFNMFNHPNFAGIDNTLGDGTFGLAGSTLNQSYGSGLNYLYAIGGPRSIQFALKLAF